MTTTSRINHVAAADGLTTYVTKDYDRFIMLEDNRSLSMAHVTRLAAEIKAHPEGMRLEPIMVNEKMEIIDGQHRLAACRAENYPVYYQIGKGLTIDDAVRMNVNRRNWTPLDYAYSYAGRGNVNYQIYLDFHHHNEDLQHETLMGYLRNGETNRAYLEFRRGEFLVTDSKTDIDRRIKQYLEIVEKLPNPHWGHGGTFARAVLIVMRNKLYDHDRMLQKLDHSASKYLNVPFVVVEDAVRALESAYNEMARTGDRVRLF